MDVDKIKRLLDEAVETSSTEYIAIENICEVLYMIIEELSLRPSFVLPKNIDTILKTNKSKEQCDNLLKRKRKGNAGDAE